jgi:hypothetical protein
MMFTIASGDAFMVPNHTYGEASFTVTATSNSTGAFTFTVVSGNATFSANTVTITGADTVMLQASEAAEPNYTTRSNHAVFTTAQAALNITANNARRVYGAASPTFTGSVAGAEVQWVQDGFGCVQLLVAPYLVAPYTDESKSNISLLNIFLY